MPVTFVTLSWVVRMTVTSSSNLRKSKQAKCCTLRIWTQIHHIFGTSQLGSRTLQQINRQWAVFNQHSLRQPQSPILELSFSRSCTFPVLSQCFSCFSTCPEVKGVLDMVFKRRLRLAAKQSCSYSLCKQAERRADPQQMELIPVASSGVKRWHLCSGDTNLCPQGVGF